MFLESRVFYKILEFAPKLNAFYWTTGETCNQYDMFHSIGPLSPKRLDAIVMSLLMF